MISKNVEELMNVKDLIKVLKCSKTFAYEIINQYDFPKIKIGKRFFIPVNEFNKWVKKYTYKEYKI